MRKTATPKQLRAQLVGIMAYCEQPNPSREALAASLRELADEVVGKGNPMNGIVGSVDRVVARFASDKTAASDPRKLLKDGWSNATLKRVKKAWDDLGKGVAEAQRQYNAAGGALPTADVNNIVAKFIHEPLKDLGEEATAWAKTLKK